MPIGGINIAKPRWVKVSNMDKPFRRREVRSGFWVILAQPSFSTLQKRCHLSEKCHPSEKVPKTQSPASSIFTEHFLAIKDQENRTTTVRVNYLKSILFKWLKTSQKIWQNSSLFVPISPNWLQSVATYYWHHLLFLSVSYLCERFSTPADLLQL